ncbi:Hpt domain-containing protein [Stenotrophomonas sp. HITSZ_GD]|uniref:hybrid sensor histidine kinase/response regulator n=1 Tax=Stenotrophomonas sp. HITSZ_GD TaxID=3037248 RepID=UPI00240D3E4B|nr:Hpt domain-containing protein [Stenotrophomonas sp. HITSZ_GD]MDG2525876.1 Hpt domain-containing protein [Stenotrophomonas sp. HITSZ_GD]
MSALRDAMSHAALGWVKPELDETLRQARHEIEFFVEEPADTSRMRFCAGYLHQVQGTLRMVELYAPAMVAEELELLAKAVQEGKVADTHEACAMLMRGTVLLPDYLERLQNGHRDIPIVLLPLLNEIRAMRGEAVLNESVLFAFDPQAGNATEAELDHARGSLSGRNRELLDTVGNAVKEELLRVKDALDLHLRTGGDVAELQAQVNDLGSVADTLGMMGLGVARNVVVQQRDALRRIVDGQQQVDEGLLLDIAGALLYVDASLDDQVARLGADASNDDDVNANANASEVRRTLEVLAHEAIANFGAAREHFVAFIETNWDHHRLADVPQLLGEVGGALRILELPEPADYLEGVRRYIERELIAKQRVPSGRQLDTLADAMASLEYYLEALRERRPGREEILDITRSSLETLRYWPLPSEDAEQALPPPAPAFVAAPVAAPVAEAVAEYAAAEPLAVEPETIEIEAIELAPVAELAEPVEARHELTVADISPLPQGLHVTAGGFEWTLQEAAPVEAVAVSFDPVAAEQDFAPALETAQIAPIDLSADGGQAPTGSEWNADHAGLSFDPVSAEQDIDAAAAQVTYRFDASQLEGEAATPAASFSEASFEPASADELPPLPPLPEVQPEPAAAAPDAPQAFDPNDPALDADSPFVESFEATLPAFLEEEAAPAADASAPHVQEGTISKIELDDAHAAFIAELDAAAAGFSTTPAPVAEAAAPVAAADAPAPLEGGFEDDGNEIDSDIRDVFLEEFDEELVNLGQLLPVWRAAPDSVENLRPIRRVFHTLKGSGRLVGARTLGEFSWKIEGMLNRVLDGTRPASPAVVAMVDQAYQVLPQLNAALRGNGRIAADLMAMQAVADRIGAGEDAWYVPTAATAAVAAPVVAEAAAPQNVFAGEGTPASVDSVLREILEAEVATHLETVHAWLAQSRPVPQPVTEALLRAVHTMSGAFAMTDVPEITAVTTPAETFVKRSLAAGRTPEAAGVDGIADTAAAIATTVAALQAESPRIPSFADVAARLRALVDTLPEAQWPPQHMLGGDEHEAIAPLADEELTGPQDLGAYLDPQVVDAGVRPADPYADLAVEEIEMPLPAEPEAVQAAPVDEASEAPNNDGLAEALAAFEALAPAAPPAEPEPAPVESGWQVEEVVLSAPEAEAPAFSPEDVGSAVDAGTEPAAPAWAIEEVIAAVAEVVPPAEQTPAFDAADVIDAAPLAEPAHEVPVVEDVVVEEIVADVPVEEAIDASALETPAEVVRVEDTDVAQTEVQATLVEATPAEATYAEAAPVEAPAEVRADTDAAAAELDAGPLDFNELDRELVDIFVEEGKDLLDHCDGLIAGLREAPEDRELVAGLQRDLHTLKGGARMAGINAIGDLGHGIESLLEVVAAHRTEIGRDDVRLLERGFDRLHQLLTRTGQHRAVRMPTDLIDAFDARTQGRTEVPAADADVARMISAAVEPVAVAPLSAPVPVEGVVDEELGPARAPQEQVRVRADLLDSLVNHAGEVAIYRSRLEQQLGAFRGAMAELDRTNARLRDQLRRLDLETEAQIVARYQREQDQGDTTFDPLELDRFSTLQQLSRALNESAADLGGLQGVLDDLSRQYDSLLQQQSRVSSELQDGLMRARMVPFDGLVPRLRRVVRQAASDTGKQVHLLLEGTHGELDRNVLDRMVAPLEHMLRNSVAHGLEKPKARREAGKAEEGTIAIKLRREGSEIVLEVSDDGAGLDREAIRRRGEQRGLIAADAVLSDNELDQLIFAAGFSTSESVSQLAGRGVGMDVVRNEVRQLGGSVDIHSVRGQGVTFTLRLPQTLAVTQAVFVRIGETTFAVPVASVSGIGRIGRERYSAGAGGYHYGGEEYALHDLGSLVGQAAANADGAAQIPLLLVRAGDLRAAVAIDQVLGNREIVVKPVGLQIASVPGIYGATITGDGRVVVILDVAPLVRRHLAQPARPAAEPVVETQRRVPLVMVVDDSLTMRKVTGRVLERHNFEVSTARDGVEALEQLEERVPDLMLLDIEMPRMDGYELATAMRADARFKDVPIVMITSRSGDKHRQRAFEIGVQRYLGKPYQELDLMRNVYDLLGIARVRE